MMRKKNAPSQDIKFPFRIDDRISVWDHLLIFFSFFFLVEDNGKDAMHIMQHRNSGSHGLGKSITIRQFV